MSTAVTSEAWDKLGDWASVAGRGRLLFSGSVAHASLKTAVCVSQLRYSSACGRCLVCFVLDPVSHKRMNNGADMKPENIFRAPYEI